MTTDDFSTFGPATRAIHCGSEPDKATGAVIVPIYQTSTYAQASPGETRGYEYSRTDNPTRSAYQSALAAVEKARFALAFASGMAAVDTIMKTLRPGDHVIAGDDLYGGTYRLFRTICEPMGIRFTFADLSGRPDLRSLMTDRTRMVWLETPSNPLLKVSDIAFIAETVHSRRITVVVDNTFMSAALQLPLRHGADIVLYSATKYIGGHSDMVGGAIVTDDEELYQDCKRLQNSAGGIPGPFDCFLAHRGLKTLPLRMQRHCDSALTIARFLEKHSAVDRVFYPFLESHPHHDLAIAQQKAGGGIVSFEIKGDAEDARRVVTGRKIFTLAESLGGVESLIELPAVMTHASVPPDVRAALGLSDRLIRLSVGLEDGDDLITDLDEALS
jgi:cystathionine gamma-lyase